MSQLLGSAELELLVDLAPLDAGLDKAKAKVAAKVAEMQAMMDSLHGNATMGASGAGGIGGIGGIGGGNGGIEGVRGAAHAGSIHNPVVMVMESAKNTPLGSYAASVGEADVTDSQRSQSGSPILDSAAISGLTSQLSQLSQSLSPLQQLAENAGSSGYGPGNGPGPTAGPVSEATSTQNDNRSATSALALQQAADALNKIQGRLTSSERQWLAAPTPSQTSTSSRGMVAPLPTRAPSSNAGPSSTSPIPVVVENYSHGGGGAAAAAGGGAAGGGNRGGGGSPPIAYGGGPSPFSGGGGGGGGSSRTLWTPVGGLQTFPQGGNPFSLANLFKGNSGNGGAFGLPAFGSVGSLAGLGLEHWMLTGAGLGASAVSAVGGAGLLAAGSAAKSLIGGGSDMLINKVTQDQIKTTTQDWYALQTAVAQYGKGSRQATQAQAAFNYSIKQMGAAAPAEMQVVKDIQSLHTEFMKDSTQARIEAAQGMDQIVQLAQTFTPLVTQAAQRNLAIVNTGLKPLFSWLEGPQGMGIFRDLENEFAQGLPTSIHAFDMGIEDLLRLLDVASQYTGGFSRTLDALFTEKNQESTAQYQAEVQKLVGDFDEWKALLSVLGQDLAGIFKADQGTANSIVQELTGMLEKLHEWEDSTTGQSQLKNIFAVHKQEILALLKVLPDLLHGYGDFYMTVAPPLVKATTDIAKGFTAIAGAIEKIPGGADVLGFGLVAAKLGILVPGLKLAAKWLGITTDAESANADAANADAAATGRLDAAERAGGGGGAAGSVEKGAATDAEEGGAAAGGGGLFAGGISDAVKVGMIAAAPEIGAAITLKVASSFGPTNKQAALNAPKTASGMPLVNPRAAPFSSPTGFQGLSKEADEQYREQGEKAAQQFELGMQSVKFPSTLSVFEGMRKQLEGLAPQARDAAAKTMIEYAQTLQSEGKLPQGAVNNLIQLIEGQFPKLRTYLKTEGANTAADFASTMKMNQAVTNTQSLVSQLKTDFGDIVSNSKVSSGNLLSEVTQDFQSLKQNIGSMTTGGKQIAAQQMGQMKTQAVQDASAMESQVSTKMQSMKGAISQGSEQAASAATSSFKAFASNIGAAMSSGLLATSKGSMLIGEALNQELKSLGAKTIPLAVLKSLSPSALLGEAKYLNTGAAGTNQGGAGHQGLAAVGGMWQIGRPGDRGHDSIPMNIGGTDLRVGSGEVAAVLNHDQQALLNSRLSDLGGLPGMFQKVNRPHYMATGGFVPDAAKIAGAPTSGGSSGGGGNGGGGGTDGYVYPFPPGTTLERVDEGRDASMPVGAPIGAIGPAVVKGILPGWYQGQPLVWEQLTAGPAAGRYVYLAEQITGIAQPGSHLTGHDALAHYAPSGTGIEMGWGTASGEPLAHSYYSEGDVTAAGTSFANFIAGLTHGTVTGLAGSGIGGGAAAPSWSDISTPKVSGSGPIAQIVEATLSKVASAANKYGLAHAPSGGGTGGIDVSLGAGTGSVLAQMYKALRAGGFNRIGASGVIGSAYGESSWNPAAIGDGGGGLWGFTTSPISLADLQAAARSAHVPWTNPTFQTDFLLQHTSASQRAGANDAGSPEAAAAWWVNQWEHPLTPAADIPVRAAAARRAFDMGYARGGLLGPDSEFAKRILGSKVLTDSQRAFVKASKPGKPKSEKPSTIIPRRGMGSGSAFGWHPPKGEGVLGKGGPFPFNASDMDPINQALAQILALDGGDGSGIGTGTPGTVMGLQNQISWDQTLWEAQMASPNIGDALNGNPSAFVITQDANGNPVTPYISPHLNPVVTQFGKLIGMQGTMVGDLRSTSRLSQMLPAVIKNAISRRTREIAKIRERIKKNKAKIKRIKARMAAIAKEIKHLNGRKQPYPSAKNASQRKANANFATDRKARIGQLNTEHSRLAKELKPISAENTMLGGSSGHGGEIGEISAQLGAGASGDAVTTVEGGGAGASGLYSLLSTVQGWDTALSGTGGDIPQEKLTLSTWQGQLAALTPGADSAYKSAAAAYAGQNASANTSNLESLLEQWKANEGLDTAVGQLQGKVLDQYKAMESLPPYGGSFATGGMVPGPVGAAATIIAHGGEMVVPAGASTTTPNVHVHIDRKSDLANLIDVRIDNASRRTARTLKRGVPSAGGGLLGPR